MDSLQKDVMNLKEHLGETSCLMFYFIFDLFEVTSLWLEICYSKTLEKWNFCP